MKTDIILCHFEDNVILGVCLKGFRIISLVLNPTFQLARLGQVTADVISC